MRASFRLTLLLGAWASSASGGTAAAHPHATAAAARPPASVAPARALTALEYVDQHIAMAEEQVKQDRQQWYADNHPKRGRPHPLLLQQDARRLERDQARLRRLRAARKDPDAFIQQLFDPTRQGKPSGIRK